MTAGRWPDLSVIGSADLPVLGDDGRLWNALFDLSERLPVDHAIIGGVMVYLHGVTAGRQPPRVTEDVDVLFDIKVMPSSLRDAVAVLKEMGYGVAPGSPRQSTHRYIGPAGESVDVLAPYLRDHPPPDLTTTPPGETITVLGGKEALEHRVLIRASHADRTTSVVVPDLARALKIKAAAYSTEHRSRPAKAFNSRHLSDLAFLVSLVRDPDAVLDDLGPAPSDGHLAQAHVLDDRGHHAWSAAGSAAEDALLAWEVLRSTVDEA